MNRRTFLKRGLAGGALLAVGTGTGLALWPTTRKYLPSKPLAVLDERRFSILAAIASRVVTQPGADPVAITHTIDQALARAVPEAQADIRSVLLLFESALAGALLDGRFRPFTALSPEAQDKVLEGWRDSRLVLRRGAYKALRNLCVTSFYRQESAWPLAGYSGPPDYVVAMAAAQAAPPAGPDAVAPATPVAPVAPVKEETVHP